LRIDALRISIETRRRPGFFRSCIGYREHYTGPHPYACTTCIEVQLALDRSRGRSPELETFYERMLETGSERFLTTPSSLDALDPLFEECPNFDDVLDDLARYLRLAHAGDKGFNVMPILLLGGPGVGKTHFAKRLARVMQTDCELISMNALSAGFVITGSSASWRGAKCGKVAERLVRGKYANPVIVLDEVEKASGSSQSDPLAALYQLLEPETACAFRDEFIDVEIDASQIFWVLTANSTEGIPASAAEPHGRVRGAGADARTGGRDRPAHVCGLLRELNLPASRRALAMPCSTTGWRIAARPAQDLLDGLGYAVADGRERVLAADIRIKPALGRKRIGF
jgi:ATP-dependent Lon protease